MFSSIKKQLLQARLTRLNFGIVPNNCWAGYFYQEWTVPYSSPFIGLYLMPDNYMYLLRRWKFVNMYSLEFVREAKHGTVNVLRSEQNKSWPNCLIQDDEFKIEIQFMHYASELDARNKWTRRLSRMPMEQDRLFFKMDDRDGCTADHVVDFGALPFRNKVCFTGTRYPKGLGNIAIPEAGSVIPAGRDGYAVTSANFDIVKWIIGNQLAASHR